MTLKRGVMKMIKSENVEFTSWRKGLQNYCAENAMDMRKGGYCLCGNMAYCCYCPTCDDKYSCVSAIMQYCNDNNIPIDYSDRDYNKLVMKIGYRKKIRK